MTEHGKMSRTLALLFSPMEHKWLLSHRVMEYKRMVYISTAANTTLAKQENSCQCHDFKEHIWSPRNDVKDWNY